MLSFRWPLAALLLLAVLCSTVIAYPADDILDSSSASVAQSVEDSSPQTDFSSTTVASAEPDSGSIQVEEPSPDYTGAQVLKVTAEDNSLVDQLIEEEKIDEWGGNKTHRDILVPKERLSEVKTRLTSKRLRFSVLIEDVQEALDLQNPPPTEEEEELAGRKGYRMNWNKYQRLEVITEYLDFLAQTYPKVATVGVMGYSHEGRPLKYIKISSGSPNAKAFFIDGGAHAREWISPSSVTYIVKELVENRDALPADVRAVDFYILPVMNPDGYEHTHTSSRLWRKNRSKKAGLSWCVGTDLNRNFDMRWGGKGTSGDSCKETYRGSSAFSEPESRAVADFILQRKDSLKGYVSFHSYGQYILVPYGYDYYSQPPDFNELLTVGNKAAAAMLKAGGARYQVGNTAHLLYPAAGGSDDWAKGKAGIKYSYTIELRDAGSYGFTLPASYILPTSKEAFEAVKVVASAVAVAA